MKFEMEIDPEAFAVMKALTHQKEALVDELREARATIVAQAAELEELRRLRPLLKRRIRHLESMERTQLSRSARASNE